MNTKTTPPLRIKELCKERGVQMKWLAAQLGISASSLSHALARNKFDLPYLAKIANALNVEVPDLFARQDTTITCPNCGAKIKIRIED